MGNIPYLKGGVVVSILPLCQSKGGTRFACAQAGCPECLENLFGENTGLVRMVIARQSPGKAEYADLLQEGWIGLWQSLLHFDPERGYAFSSYASVVIRRRIWAVVRRSLKAEGWQAAERTGDSLSWVVSAWQATQIRQALNEELDSLPVRLRQLIILRYGLDGAAPQTTAEIGRAWGVSGEWVRQLHHRALVLLRLPAFSIRLRSICERQSAGNYRQALRQNQAWLRKQRRQR